MGATWASDLLLGMDDAGGHGAAADAGGGGGGSCFEFLDAPLSPAAEDVYVYAKALLDRREFLRVADLIERRAPLPCHNLLRFVRWYAKFMSGASWRRARACVRVRPLPVLKMPAPPRSPCVYERRMRGVRR